MLAIVHYEVYIQSKGRWSFHARYPSAEREDALSDARRTEVMTGHPTKVMRDTYYPTLNYSEEIPAYVSPNAINQSQAAQLAAAQTGRLARGGEQTESTGRLGKRRKQLRGSRSTQQPGAQPTEADLLVRLLLALIASLIVATVLTGLLSLVLIKLPAFGYNISDTSGSRTLVIWYVAMFGLCAVALVKAYVPYQILLRRSGLKKERVRPPPAKALKPKRSPAFAEAEAALERAQLKLARGDLDAPVPPPETLDSDNSVDDGATHTPASTDNFEGKAEPESQKAKPKPKQPEKDVKAPPQLDDPPPEPAKKPAAAEVKSEQKADTPSEKIVPLTELTPQRLMLMTFLGDAVIALRNMQDDMDAYDRFGMSLYLAGATSAVAERFELDEPQRRDLLTEALSLIGHKSSMIESFFNKFDQHIEARSNRSIIEAGREAMSEHFINDQNKASGLHDHLASWRRPSPIENKLTDVFLLTRIDPEIAQQAVPQSENHKVLTPLELHNRRVRKVLSDCSGEEIRHTGVGIFARFTDPDDAICAAIAMQQDRMRETQSVDQPPELQVAIVAGEPGESDSWISGETFQRADTLCRQAETGQILCDKRVRSASQITNVQYGPEGKVTVPGSERNLNTVEIVWETGAI